MSMPCGIKTGWSTLANEVVENECKLQLIHPNQTRWNSIYLAVERITRIIQEKGEDAIRNVRRIKSENAEPAEMSFLNEYCKVMTPLVSALNILQPETNTHMRWLLPVIFLLKTKLQRREASCQMCLPLIRAIQNGLQKLFGEMMEEPQLLAAVILLPKFKTS